MLREERRLRVCENRMLRRIFGPKRNEVTGGWRKIHKKGLRDLYSSPSMILLMKLRRMIWARAFKTNGENLKLGYLHPVACTRSGSGVSV
jgi:hypothetical protein